MIERFGHRWGSRIGIVIPPARSSKRGTFTAGWPLLIAFDPARSERPRVKCLLCNRKERRTFSETYRQMMHPTFVLGAHRLTLPAGLGTFPLAAAAAAYSTSRWPDGTGVEITPKADASLTVRWFWSESDGHDCRCVRFVMVANWPVNYGPRLGKIRHSIQIVTQTPTPFWAKSRLQAIIPSHIQGMRKIVKKTELFVFV